MSVIATVGMQMTIVETLETNVPATTATTRKVTHSANNLAVTLPLGGGSPVPASQCAVFPVAMVAGVAEINLAALLGTNGATVVGTGQKVQAVIFEALAGNTNPVKIATGASNGYELAGADFAVTLKARQRAMFYLAEQAPDVASGDRILDVTGTGTEGLNVTMVLG